MGSILGLYWCKHTFCPSKRGVFKNSWFVMKIAAFHYWNFSFVILFLFLNQGLHGTLLLESLVNLSCLILIMLKKSLSWHWGSEVHLVGLVESRANKLFASSNIHISNLHWVSLHFLLFQNKLKKIESGVINIEMQ